MKIKEAELLIGKLVKFYSLGGFYIGELLSIEYSKPFRANVKILNMAEHPFLYCHNTKGGFIDYPVRIHNESEIINVGNRIETYEGELESYKDSVIKSLQTYLDAVENHINYYSTHPNLRSHYISSLEDSIKLKEIIEKRINDTKNDISRFFFER